MVKFWAFARQMLHYRRLLILGLIAAVLDAGTAFAGLGLMKAIITMTFEQGLTLHDYLAAQLAQPDVINVIGHRQHWADLVPDDMFIGFALAVAGILPLALFGSSMRFTYQVMSFTVSLRTVMRIRQQAYFHMLHAPIEDAAHIASADRLSRLMADTSTLGKGFNTLMGKAVRDLLMGLVGLSMAILIDWKLTGIFLLGLPLIGIAIRKFGKTIRRAAKYSLRQYAVMTGAVQETMQNPAVVRLHNAEGYERRRFNTINRRVVAQEMRARTAKALASPVIEFIALCGLVAVSLIAAYYVFRVGSVQPTDVLAVLICLGFAAMSVKPLANLNNDLQESGAAATRIAEVMEAPVEPVMRPSSEDGANTLPDLPRHRRDIVFESVSYRYPGSDELAVAHVDLRIEHGQSVAIVGTNGSGKSTLLNLLPRLTTPAQGRVRIDGTDIAEVSLRSLRRQMSMVTQQSVLFAGTIADNIAYGRRDTPRHEIVAAARAAFADEFVAELPKGYDTVLGEGGSGCASPGRSSATRRF
jgi:ABC-type multidrug transport system fused ATPase/permease subunit